MKVEWHINANNDFIFIVNYIKKDSPKYANIFVEKVFESIDKIIEFNGLGRVVEEFDDKNIREILFWSYRFIYEIHKNDIVILAIVHSKRSFNFD